MKRVSIWMLALIVAMTAITAQAAATPERPRMILLTVYQQMGWGDRIDVGCVDEEGGVWTMTGSASSVGWPGGIEAQLVYLHDTALLERIGEFSSDELFDLKGLIACTEAQPVKASPVANDAGTEISYAIRYSEAPEIVRLGMSGDDVYENTDPNAQALYAMLRQLFPNVTCYGDTMGPTGFRPIPAAEFLGLDRETVRSARMKAYIIDCEAGPREVESVDESLREIVLSGMVTGKANATMVTGGTTSIGFYDEDDNYLGGFELYRGLLVMSDGMYRIE